MKKQLMLATILIIISILMIGCVPQNSNNDKKNNASQSSKVNKEQQPKLNTIQTDKPEATKSDTFYVEEVVSNYEKLLVEAINNNNFSLIENLLVPNSNLYNSQKKLVSDLYSKNIKEKLINFNIINIQDAGQNGYYKVYITENIGVKYPNKQDFEAKEYNWVYTVIKDNNGVGLSDIEKWEK